MVLLTLAFCITSCMAGSRIIFFSCCIAHFNENKTKHREREKSVEAIRGEKTIYACRRTEEHSHLSEVKSLEREHKIVLYHVHFFM